MATCFDYRPPCGDVDRSLLGDDTYSTADFPLSGCEVQGTLGDAPNLALAGVASSSNLAMNLGYAPAAVPLGPGIGMGPAPGFVTGSSMPVFLRPEPQGGFSAMAGQPLPGNGLGLILGSGFEGFSAGDILTMEARNKLLKNPKQQAANKVSQQRYRERKKAKYQEMEETIVQLQQQLHQLQALQRRNHLLEGANTDLETKLVEQEREVEQLKFALDRQSDRSLEPAVAQVLDTAMAPAADPALVSVVACCADSTAAAGHGSATVCCTPLGRDVSEIDFEGEFERRMGQLRGLMERAGLRNGDPSSAAAVSRETMAELALLVSRCCQLRQAAMAAEGAKALALFEGGRKWVSGMEVDAGGWANVLQVLHLSDDQQEQLLLLRQAHLSKLRAIYQERQDLNLEAMSLMLPRQSPLLQQDTTIEGKLANMGSSGHLAVARGNAILSSLLDRLKDTMRREQRAVMELNSLAISKILTPVQAGLYMVLSYPELGDVLALVNALARHLGQDDLPGGCCGGCARQLRQGTGAEAGAFGRVKSFAHGEGAILSGRAGGQVNNNDNAAVSAGTCCKGGGGGCSVRSGSCSIGEAGGVQAAPAPAEPQAVAAGGGYKPEADPADGQPAVAGGCCMRGAGSGQPAAGGCCKAAAGGRYRWE